MSIELFFMNNVGIESSVEVFDAICNTTYARFDSMDEISISPMLMDQYEDLRLVWTDVLLFFQISTYQSPKYIEIIQHPDKMTCHFKYKSITFVATYNQWRGWRLNFYKIE
jgi:hypothetical protein